MKDRVKMEKTLTKAEKALSKVLTDPHFMLWDSDERALQDALRRLNSLRHWVS